MQQIKVYRRTRICLLLKLRPLGVSGKRTPIPANGSLFRLVRSCVVRIPTPALVLPALVLPALVLPAVAPPAVAPPAVAPPAVALPAETRAVAAQVVEIPLPVAEQAFLLAPVPTQMASSCVARATSLAVVAPMKATPLPGDLSLRVEDPLALALGPLGPAPGGRVAAVAVAVAVAAVAAVVLAVAVVGEVPIADPLAAAAVSSLAAVAVAADLQQLLVCLLFPAVRSSFLRRTI